MRLYIAAAAPEMEAYRTDAMEFLRAAGHNCVPESLNATPLAPTESSYFSAMFRCEGALLFVDEDFDDVLRQQCYGGDAPRVIELRVAHDLKLRTLACASHELLARKRGPWLAEFGKELERYRWLGFDRLDELRTQLPDAIAQLAMPPSPLRLRRLRDGSTIPLYERPNVIGRMAGRVDIVLDDPAVSRRHACITVEGARASIEDLQSRGGTYVNSTRMEPGGRLALSVGDAVLIGAQMLRLESIENAPATRAEPLTQSGTDPVSSSDVETTDKVDSVLLRRPPEQEPTVKLSPPATAPKEEPTAPMETPPPYLDENVQFTVYRPQAMPPLKWMPLLAFAHLSEKPPDAPEDASDPIEEMEEQARMVLGKLVDQYKDVRQDSKYGVPRMGEITFLPEIPGIGCNPHQATFQWEEQVHRVEFRMMAGAELEGQTARGRLTVFLGSILLAEIPLAIRVQSAAAAKRPKLEKQAARPYRKIFPSYSRHDTEIVEQFERYGQSLGDKYLRDVMTLRAGEEWNTGLLRLIEQADVFQLFWSSHSMRSTYCREEWEHALDLRRAHFIRPVFWEDPFPETEDKSLPPERLRALHFQRIGTDLGPRTLEKEREEPATKPGGRKIELSPPSPNTPSPIPGASYKGELHRLFLTRFGLTPSMDEGGLRRELRRLTEMVGRRADAPQSLAERDEVIEEIIRSLRTRPQCPDVLAETPEALRSVLSAPSVPDPPSPERMAARPYDPRRDKVGARQDGSDLGRTVEAASSPVERHMRVQIRNSIFRGFEWLAALVTLALIVLYLLFKYVL